jgi:septum formation protein
MNALQLVLASASPRRRELLRGIGLEPRILVPGIDERAHPDEAPSAQVLRLAEAKGRAAAARLPPSDPAAVVLAADTVVTIDGTCLGKPSGPEQARSMLQALSGRKHRVLTGVYLERTDDGRSVGGVETTAVHFLPYDDRTIRAYVSTGEPMDKAGGYGIQGRGALLCRRIDGSWSNVVGLPLERLPDWLESIGIDLWQWLAPGGSRP